jgi:hypothetical protein
MIINSEHNSEKDEKEFLESRNTEFSSQQPKNRSSIPTIAGIILIIAGILAILNWIQTYTLNVETLESFLNISQIQELNPSITLEQLLGIIHICAIIGVIISLFPILGGLLAIKRKLFYIALAGSILGLFSIGFVFSSSILSLIGLVLLFISRKEFQ